MKRRLVLYVGYDGKSASFLRRVSMYRDLFDEVRVIYVPESDPDVLSKMSVPSALIEEVAV